MHAYIIHFNMLKRYVTKSVFISYFSYALVIYITYEKIIFLFVVFIYTYMEQAEK